jgi:hypothetical protein
MTTTTEERDTDYESVWDEKADNLLDVASDLIDTTNGGQFHLSPRNADIVMDAAVVVTARRTKGWN